MHAAVDGYDAVHNWSAWIFNDFFNKKNKIEPYILNKMARRGISEVERWLVAAWQLRVWIRDIGLNEEFTV